MAEVTVKEGEYVSPEWELGALYQTGTDGYTYLAISNGAGQLLVNLNLSNFLYFTDVDFNMRKLSPGTIVELKQGL